MDKKKKAVAVYRITVDERLSEDLIRLEVSELIMYNTTGEFRDEPEFWEEKGSESGEVLARPHESKRESKQASKELTEVLTDILLSKIQWKDLKDGQVYLLGEFEIKKEKDVNHYFIRPGASAFEQIDDDVYDHTKILYYEVLGKDVKHG